MNSDLEHLKAAWTKDARTGRAVETVENIAEQVKCRIRSAWIIVALEVVMTIGLLSILAFVFFTLDDWLLQIWLAVISLIIIVVQTWMLRARAKVWRMLTALPSQHARFHVEQAALNLKFARFAQFGAPIGLIMGYLTMALTKGAFFADSSRLAVTVLLMVGCVVFTHFWIAKRRLELNSAKIVEKELKGRTSDLSV